MATDRPAPPDDGKYRVEVHTNRRSYSVIEAPTSRVAWMPGERVVHIAAVPRDRNQPERQRPQRGRTGRGA